jgi:hypothetical protein
VTGARGGNEIVLPSDHTTWSDSMIAICMQTDVEAIIDDFDELIRPAFLCFHLKREVLSQYCEKKGYQLPRFRFSGGRDRAWNSAVRRKASDWLTQLSKGPKLKPKALTSRKLYGHFRVFPSGF